MIATMHPVFAPLRTHPLYMIDSPLRMIDTALRKIDLAHHGLAPTARTHTTEAAHVVTLPAPGFAPDDVTVDVHDRTLTIVGKNKRKRVEVSLVLPRDADPEAAKCEVADGLITVHVNKRPKPTPTHVAIGTTIASESESDDDAAYMLSLAAPGFAAADLAVSVEDGVLSVSGESKRTGAHLERRARLPRDADVEQVTATHVDGMLTVRVPTKPAAEPRRVPVNVEAAAVDAKEADHDEVAVPGAADDKHETEAEATEAEGVEDAVMV